VGKFIMMYSKLAKIPVIRVKILEIPRRRALEGVL
jgi:hypothetical protein